RVDPEARHGDLRLVAVLLEEHPLQSLGPGEAIGRKKRRALREVEEDGTRLCQATSLVENERRNGPVPIDCEEIPRARFALEDVLLNQAKRNAQLRQQQAYLVAVSGGKIVVESQHCMPVLPRTGTLSDARPMSMDET